MSWKDKHFGMSSATMESGSGRDSFVVDSVVHENAMEMMRKQDESKQADRDDSKSEEAPTYFSVSRDDFWGMY